MMASGTLSSRPKQRPTAHPGHGKRAEPMTNPIPKRAMKAAVIAACLSREAHRQHNSDVNGTEHQTTDNTEKESGHATLRFPKSCDRASPNSPVNQVIP